ncbi:HsdR family type I site-specific deoxyribonuclease [Mycoplasma bradburyae]|uniref:Type I restriction enzyme endonuclease subunit n=1 Tax=Mycoplasma bradburyae TaxID=2963128 RepID=A0AAW6HQA6_9MOLU|nr:HsdR family type I site-specific deoxyribonuclease [Mycoplasma bradburyae]MDC4183627.1 HsdR family type I site-specific deoxyribonuclease [Mycoplasma bradburyae]
MANKKSLFNEMTRVQLPAIVHLTRLGYQYIGKITEEMKGDFYDPETNILIKIFKEQFAKLNPDHVDKFEEIIRDIKVDLNNDDLGKSFYKKLISVSPYKFIDFENINNNTFHVTGEFSCKNGDDEFRPDITLFINGLPLVFIEVKQPNNNGGMLEESKRLTESRFPKNKFRRFINITQLMIFSNNMEYDKKGGIIPIEGVFYCTASKKEALFNCFREENPKNEDIAPYIKNYQYKALDKDIERKILSDFNYQVIHTTPEYQTNININTPTNRTLTSMCSKERLLFIIRYGIAYVNDQKEIDGKINSIEQKQIIRYQQLFAALSIIEKLNEGTRSGIIWHTQGSGKTALSYYLNSILKDYYAKKNIVAKFYFIVDRIDLLEQATQEFEARGCYVKKINSKDELMKHFRNNQSLEGSSGQNEISVVNIQKFAQDKDKIELNDYGTNLQRIFIIDEAHRGYNPKGCFLANLFNSDKNSIKIALTGTPLLAKERSSWKIFGNYIHTYYYDKSIQDGYTVKIIREDIKTSYKEKLNKIYDELNYILQKNKLGKNSIVEHENYVKELIKYIISDLKEFRTIRNDNTLGGMVICRSSEQAKKFASLFDEVQNEVNNSLSNEKDKSYFKIGLILHDVDDKETRKRMILDYKKNMSIDILVVFNMLLTGFDAPRLKRLYFGRKLKEHNLLQAITRVNRPYKNNRYGYLIDFADIKKNFKQTNEAYLKELNRFNDGNQIGIDANNTLSKIIEDPEALIENLKEAKQALFEFTIENLEVFNKEISEIKDKKNLLRLKCALESAKDSFNIITTFGDDELKNRLQNLQIDKLPQMLSVTQKRINIINQKEMMLSDDYNQQTINAAMAEIEFSFEKIGDEELSLISDDNDLKTKWEEVIKKFGEYIDPEDPEYLKLKNMFFQKMKDDGFTISSFDEFNDKKEFIDEIINSLKELKRKDDVLLKKYNGDEKFVRIHKRIKEKNINKEKEKSNPIISNQDDEIVNTLNVIKTNVDNRVYDRNDILKKESYFNKAIMNDITTVLKELNVRNERKDKDFILSIISREYLSQYNDMFN